MNFALTRLTRRLLLLSASGGGGGGTAHVSWLLGPLTLYSNGSNPLNVLDGAWDLTDSGAHGTGPARLIFTGLSGYGSYAWDPGTLDLTGVTVTILDSMDIQIDAPWDWLVTLLSGTTDATLIFTASGVLQPGFSLGLNYYGLTSGNNFSGVSDNIAIITQPEPKFLNLTAMTNHVDFTSGDASGMKVTVLSSHDSRKGAISQWFEGLRQTDTGTGSTTTARMVTINSQDEAGAARVYWDSSPGYGFSAIILHFSGGVSGTPSGDAIFDVTGHWLDEDVNHVIVSWDMTGVSPIVSCAINGASVAMNEDFSTIAVGATPMIVAYAFFGTNSDAAQIFFRGNAGEIWFAPGHYLDLTDEAIIAKFWNGAEPMDIGTNGEIPLGVQPVAYFKSKFLDGFSTNWGSEQCDPIGTLHRREPIAKGWHYDNGDYHITQSGVGPDASFGVLSIWARMNAWSDLPNAAGALVGSDTANMFNFAITKSNGKLFFSMADTPAGANQYVIGFDQTMPVGEWVNFLLVWDLSNPAGSRYFQGYMNRLVGGVLVETPLTIQTVYSDVGVSASVGWESESVNLCVGNYNPAGGNYQFVGDIAEVWFQPAYFIDFSVEDSADPCRRSFIGKDGLPVFPGQDTQEESDIGILSQIRLRGTHHGITGPNNYGAAGAMSAVGSITDSSTSPDVAPAPLGWQASTYPAGSSPTLIAGTANSDNLVSSVFDAIVDQAISSSVGSAPGTRTDHWSDPAHTIGFSILKDGTNTDYFAAEQINGGEEGTSGLPGVYTMNRSLQYLLVVASDSGVGNFILLDFVTA